MKINIQILGIPKCQNSNKALRFFKERGIKVHFVNLNEKPISRGELTNISRAVPLEELIDREGKEYRKAQLEYMVYDIEGKILENSLLLKTPIVRNGSKATVGYEPDIWKIWLQEAKNA